MGLTKTEDFTARQNALAYVAKAIGHPARIAILEYLLECKTCVTGNLVEVLPLSQSTVSQHLKELKNAELIKGTIEGTSVCYCINAEIWKFAGKMILEFFNTYKDEKECC
jgi:DNA-binding transcriptional ArsR family regulator